MKALPFVLTALFTATVLLLDVTCHLMDPRIRVPGRAAE